MAKQPTSHQTPSQNRPYASFATASNDLALGYSARAASEEAFGLGCGNLQAIADLRAGETVIDLGRGAGFDCLVAAQARRSEWSRDPRRHDGEMIAKTRNNATAAECRVPLRRDRASTLLQGAPVDVVISSCVIKT